MTPAPGIPVLGTRPRDSAMIGLASGIGRPDFFLLTGTGRCGTMLLAKLLSEADDAVCQHEACFRHQSMVDFCVRGDLRGYQTDIQAQLMPKIAAEKKAGRIYGVSSGHAYFALDQLYEQFGSRARFVLVVREPSEFVRSALARGFFDPTHPNRLEQTPPPPDDPIAPRWAQASPLEKCLWYWRLVNGHVLSVFGHLPQQVCRAVRMEDLSTEVVMNLRDFMGIRGLPQGLISQGLSRRVNISPRGGANEHVNPYSQPITLPTLDQWTPEQIELLRRYTEPLRTQLYGPLGRWSDAAAA